MLAITPEHSTLFRALRRVGTTGLTDVKLCHIWNTPRVRQARLPFQFSCYRMPGSKVPDDSDAILSKNLVRAYRRNAVLSVESALLNHVSGYP